jgi:hypothetical protein
VKASQKKAGREKNNENGWYRIDSITSHKVVQEKNHKRLKLKVQWEGYEERSWEHFSGFAKDAPIKVERYFLKKLFKPL